MARFALTIFLSAFLIFQIQPVIGRFILPWFGGTPMVWSACMLFFQVCLLVGYLYAHFLVSFLSLRKQSFIHGTLVLLSLLFLPVIPEKSPTLLLPGNTQFWIILKILFFTVALPFSILSATAPLLQNWFANLFPNTSSYRLYALSNTGSILALLSYPFLIEINFSLYQQSWLWSFGFVTFSLLTLSCVYVCTKINVNLWSLTQLEDHQTANNLRHQLTVFRVFQWCLYSACGSILLLSTTNHLCLDLAVIPFLWILPLCLYLLSFIICFDRPALYHRAFWMIAFVVSTSLLVKLLLLDFNDHKPGLVYQVVIVCSALFSGVMICHGELVRLKPNADKSSFFYLCLALGGALGGLFVNFIAPLLFNGFWELHLGLVLSALILSFSLIFGVQRYGFKTQLISAFLCIVGVVILSDALISHIRLQQKDAIYTTRGFHGVLYVYDQGSDNQETYRTFYHGRIRHGEQWLSGQKRYRPSSYFTYNSGVGLAIQQHPKRLQNQPLKIGVVGLGIGTIAAYGQPIDQFRFYEINPQVTDVAKRFFHYLDDSSANISIFHGDGRLILEKELYQNELEKLDILIIDAFSGDAIPIHLLTKEAGEIYFNRLNEEGILAIHITNAFVNLSDVVRTLALDAHRTALHVISRKDQLGVGDYNEWVLITKNNAFLHNPEVLNEVVSWESTVNHIHWTDDFSNLFEVLRW